VGPDDHHRRIGREIQERMVGTGQAQHLVHHHPGRQAGDLGAGAVEHRLPGCPHRVDDLAEVDRLHVDPGLDRWTGRVDQGQRQVLVACLADRPGKCLVGRL
jgi:hypothetical protein